MTGPIKSLVFILCGVILSAGPSFSASFERVADAVEAGYRQSMSEKELTLKRIEQRRMELEKILTGLESSVASAESALAEERERLKVLAGQRDELKQHIQIRLANKEELDVIIADHVRNFLGRCEESPYSAEAPGRVDQLRSWINGSRAFSMDDMKRYIDLCFDDMERGREVAFYRGSVMDRGGRENQGEILRLGHLTALHRTGGETGFLSLSPASGRLVTSARPPFLVRHHLESYFEGRSDDVFLDLSGGIAIRQLARRTSLADQLRSGGVLVIPILLVGLVALILTVERFVFLGRVRQNTDALMTGVTGLVLKGDFDGALEVTLPHRNRPTGRVLMAGLKHRNETRTVVESALSEAILKETPRLERFIGALKVSAAVAPLLGLLGTVTGMINTFQVITTHGTGDPRLMAGGISEAMVTTQVGLAVAIPIMMIAAFLGRRAHALSQDMEEKGLALMAALLKVKNNGDR